MPTDFERRAAALRLKEMFAGRHFDICAVDQVLQLLGIQRGSDYEALRVLHCINWNKMPGGMAQEVMERTLNMLRRPLDLKGIEEAVGLLPIADPNVLRFGSVEVDVAQLARR